MYMCLCTAIGKILMILFPEAVKRYILKLGQKSSMVRNSKFSYENWGPTFFSFKYLLFVLKVKWKRLEDEAFEGHVAPNTPVVDLEGKAHHILDFMQGECIQTHKLPPMEKKGKVKKVNEIEGIVKLPKIS